MLKRFILATVMFLLPSVATAQLYRQYDQAVRAVRVHGETVPVFVTRASDLSRTFAVLSQYDHPSILPTLVILDGAPADVRRFYGAKGYLGPYVCALSIEKAYEPTETDKLACYGNLLLTSVTTTADIEQLRAHAARRHIPTSYTQDAWYTYTYRTGLFRRRTVTNDSERRVRLARIGRLRGEQCDQFGCTEQPTPVPTTLFVSTTRRGVGPVQKRPVQRPVQSSIQKPTQKPVQSAVQKSQRRPGLFERLRERREQRRARRLGR